jgi:hypothetical protein
MREYNKHVRWKSRHWGQLKLLVSEIEFLTSYYERNYLVVYAGAAPGVHVPILADMFSTMHFILIDPQSSMIANGQYANIQIIQAMMTDELARELASHPWRDKILFISDVRIGPSARHETAQEHQERIHRDMLSQKGWLEILQPVASILKFRLPWDGASTRYLDGKILFPVYGKEVTHEARLWVPKGANIVDYDNKQYEGVMAYFNQEFRPAIYEFAGQYKCFDCTSFRWIVGKYLQTAGMTHSDAAIDRKCVIIEITLFRFRQKYNKKLRKNWGCTSSCKDAEQRAGGACMSHRHYLGQHEGVKV